MNMTGLLKQLKKKLRMKRRWLSLGVWLFVVISISAAGWLLTREAAPTDPLSRTVSSSIQETAEPGHQQSMLDRIKSVGKEVEVFMQTNFVCGQDIEPLGAKAYAEIEALHQEHPDWAISLNGQGQVYFVAHVDDLSQHCKEHAYFGLDKGGNLSLFDGLPGEENVLRTFFQLNITHMESSLPHQTVKELRDGIRVTDMSEYNSILSTFSDFAVEETEKAMKPAM
ncbi:BofC C-terminal domain-containing protein [Paenibacillus sp. y28]|uniref:BofC C-terminal domain-containing protein n=1 Tax=Paenibacillus sp. y28 TaxID=3129110 RepID=UPI003018842A